MSSSSLPDPDLAALDRSQQLRELIVRKIDASAQRAIAFDDYMQLALYTPKLGYYAAPQAIFGEAGDFVTAPESGELFGRCVARQCADILNSGNDTVVEYGAGSGALAETLLTHLGSTTSRVLKRYHIVDPSAELRARQRARLQPIAAELGVTLGWSTDHLQSPVEGVVIANEVLDAMPAKRYVVETGGLRELGVALLDGHLTWRALSSPLPPAELQQQLSAYPVGYSTECLSGLGGWLADLRATLRRGVVLLIDYGYPRHEFFHPDRSGGTLKCHYQHLVHSDPFAFPGLQDLTTAINFTEVAERAISCGFSLSGFTSQTRFLLSAGLESMIATASDGDAVAAYRLAQEAKRLLLPGEMGQTFKFMALSVDHDEPLIGFGDDERHRLAGFAD